MTHSSSLLVELNDGCARVTLNRPDRRNAFDARMVEELCEAFTFLGHDSSAKTIILTGSGPTFCAGADINWLMAGGAVTGAQAREDAEQLVTMFCAIDECPQPVIARIQGGAFGGGVGLVAACDIAIADEGAMFAFSEVRLGMVPGVIAPLLLRKTGHSFLRRFCLTGEVFSASVAKRYGLVHDVVARDELDSRIAELVHTVLHLAPQAVRDTKDLLRRLCTVSDDERWSVGIEANAHARISAEAQEGLRAFLERRAPRWTEMLENQSKKPLAEEPCDVPE